MWRSAKMLAGFVLGLIVLDQMIGALVTIALSRECTDPRLETLLEGGLQPEVAIIGSSRAARNIIAKRIEETTGHSAFNFGYPGSNVAFHREIARFVREHDPELHYVVWVLDDDRELKQSQLSFRTDVLYPYADRPDVRAILVGHGELDEKYARLSHAYRERLAFQELLKTWLRPKGHDLNAVLADGSMPLSGRSVTFATMKMGEYPKPYSTSDEDPKLVAAFTDTVRSLSGCTIVFVFPPNYSPSTPGFRDRIRSLAGERHLYLDYSNDPIDRDSFYDSSHLSAGAAQTLSTKLAGDLKNAFGMHPSAIAMTR